MDEIIKKVVRIFKKFKIRYAILGGIAASIFGRPRMTLDVDIVVILSNADLNILLVELLKKGFLITDINKTIKKLSKLLPVKIKYRRGGSVDFRVASYSLDKSAIERAKIIKLFNIKLPVISPEDIIVYKMARFNDLDKSDIKSIIERYGKKLDWAYIKESAEQLKKESGIEKIKLTLRDVIKWC